MSAPTNPDWEGARSFLGKLQREAYMCFGLPSPNESRNGMLDDQGTTRTVYEGLAKNSMTNGTFDEFMAEFRASVTKAQAACPTPFEDAGWYMLLLGWYDQLERSASEMNLVVKAKPLLGTLPTGRVNGMAIGLPGNPTRIVLLEQGLFTFANLMSKAVAMAFPFRGSEGNMATFSTEEGEIRRGLVENTEPIGRFVDALCAYVITGRPTNARPYIPSGHSMRLAQEMRESMELFVLGHELGHVIGGHLDGPRTLRAVAAGIEAEEISTTWQQEFEADSLGLVLMIRSMLRKKFDLSLSYWGAHLFFGCIDMVDRTVSMLATGKAEQILSESHPPSSARQELLKLVLTQVVDDQEQVTAALRLAGAVDLILAIFWERTERILQKMHADGLRPGQWWLQGSTEP